MEAVPTQPLSPSSSIQLTTHRYASDDPFQTYDIYIPSRPTPTPTPIPSPSPKPWLIYIHGGAWRDPAITSRSILPTISLLDTNPQPFAGYASLSYRLSPYPSSPSHVQPTIHPAHLSDILYALAHLQKAYPSASSYILVGHSAGATLALQTLMPFPASADCLASPIQPPLAVVGVAGIYSLPLLVQNHAQQPVYREMVEGAFGSDDAVWREASPALFHGWASLLRRKGQEEEGVALVLAYSEGDELVEKQQVETMLEAVKDGDKDPHGRQVDPVELQGGHDELWEKGEGVSRAVQRALDILNGPKRQQETDENSQSGV